MTPTRAAKDTHANSPRITCVVELDLSADLDEGFVDIRKSLKSWPSPPPRATVRILLGAAAYAPKVDLPLLASLLRDVGGIEIVARRHEVAVEMFDDLLSSIRETAA